MILVDAITEHATPLPFKWWSHMVSTASADELHAMAARIGLKRAWFQTRWFDHYDVTPTKRALAIKHGAIAVSGRVLLFANYDYARRRPGRAVPEPYATLIRNLVAA